MLMLLMICHQLRTWTNSADAAGMFLLPQPYSRDRPRLSASSSARSASFSASSPRTLAALPSAAEAREGRPSLTDLTDEPSLTDGSATSCGAAGVGGSWAAASRIASSSESSPSPIPSARGASKISTTRPIVPSVSSTLKPRVCCFARVRTRATWPQVRTPEA